MRVDEHLPQGQAGRLRISIAELSGTLTLDLAIH